MALTTWPHAVDSIIAALRDALNVSVFDCADDTGYGDELSAFVVVGAASLDDGMAGSFTQEYHDLGPTATRDDSGAIGCIVVAQSGDDDVQPVRAAAFAVLGDVETVLRATPGLDVEPALRIELQSGDVYQGRADDYTFCEIRFTLAYTALI